MKYSKPINFTAAVSLVALFATGIFATAGLATAPKSEAATKTIEILAVNDFHGHIEAGALSAGKSDSADAGAAELAGAVQAEKAENPNTVFVSAGDNIGGSPFISFSAGDTPSMKALKSAGLALSAVGNHEFDRGYPDLKNRVLNSESGWGVGSAAKYGLGANVWLDEQHTKPALPAYTTETIGGTKVGFIGVATQETAATTQNSVYFSDEVEAINKAAKALHNCGVKTIVVLAHDGSEQASPAAIVGENSSFARMIKDSSPYVDAIFGAHTHQTFAFTTPIAGMTHERAVLEGGNYGQKLSKLTLQLNNCGAVEQLAPETLSLRNAVTEGSKTSYTPKYEPVESVAKIVAAAKSSSSAIGNQVIGHISGDITRGYTPNSAGALTENRAIESGIGNLIADIDLAQSQKFNAQIAITNPGGLRGDLRFGTDGIVTYAQAVALQPYANDLMVGNLTYTDLKTTLEQQWQPEGSARPFLKLGISANLTYIYDAAAPRGEHIKEIYFNGQKLPQTATLRVAANSFLLPKGGDNFTALRKVTDVANVGVSDLQAVVDYFRDKEDYAEIVNPPALNRALEISELAK